MIRETLEPEGLIEHCQFMDTTGTGHILEQVCRVLDTVEPPLGLLPPASLRGTSSVEPVRILRLPISRRALSRPAMCKSGATCLDRHSFTFGPDQEHSIQLALLQPFETSECPRSSRPDPTPVYHRALSTSLIAVGDCQPRLIIRPFTRYVNNRDALLTLSVIYGNSLRRPSEFRNPDNHLVLPTCSRLTWMMPVSCSHRGPVPYCRRG